MFFRCLCVHCLPFSSDKFIKWMLRCLCVDCLPFHLMAVIPFFSLIQYDMIDPIMQYEFYSDLKKNHYTIVTFHIFTFKLLI